MNQGSLRYFLVEFLLGLSVTSLLSLMAPVATTLCAANVGLFGVGRVFSTCGSYSVYSLGAIGVGVGSFTNLSGSIFTLFVIRGKFRHL